MPETFTNFVIKEHSNIAIHSDHHHNPSSPDYDLKILPTTYEEPMQGPNHEAWLEAMQRELGIMKEMSIYKFATLPPGQKVIGNCWILEFKDDNKGSPVYKAHLVA
ncbi:hypothetical protein BDR04DRAFT_1116434 [Suillus decipiens]|nr:hypothetical protein BDR04DRAFT_1116434 [Suillus decipiens]